LESWFHFSFAEYRNPDNIRFGVLRVFNDDTVQPGTGFPTHPHRDMEIISYVVQGELSHKDSMGNEHTLTRGQSQYMSAGTGVTHSEFNLANDVLRFMQIWIFPDKEGYTPNYGDYRFVLEDRFDKWLPIATGYKNAENNAPIKVHADINAYATILSAGNSIELKIGDNRQAYLVLLEGEASVGDIHLKTRDALEIVKETIAIIAEKSAHVFVLEMEYDDVCYKEKYGDEQPLRNGA
jgi:redox-sensitive bicupin YhaK (pirin superfamily)